MCGTKEKKIRKELDENNANNIINHWGTARGIEKIARIADVKEEEME